jgi:hypothetical protein
MGHRVNPLFFRLGFSKDWSYQLRDPLLMNIFIYRLIRSLVFQYSAPYTSYQIKRNSNVLHNYIRKPRFYPPELKQVKKSQAFEIIAQKKKLIQNPFKRASFTFSHINVSRNPNLFISIFLFDEAAERHRVRNRLPEKYFYCLSGKYYHNSHRWYSFFQKYHFHASTGNRGKRILRPWFFKGFRNFINSRIYLKRLKTTIQRRKKHFRRVTQFEPIFRSKIPKKKFVSRKGRYSRIRILLKLRYKKHDQKQFDKMKRKKKIKKYPVLLRIAFSKTRSTPLLFKQIHKYRKKVGLMRKEALSYQMRFLRFKKNRKVILKVKKKKNIKRNKLKTSKNKSPYRKRLSLLWKTLYRTKTIYINKSARKIIKKELKLDAKEFISTNKFISRMKRILAVADGRIALEKERKVLMKELKLKLRIKKKNKEQKLEIKKLLRNGFEQKVQFFKLNRVLVKVRKEMEKERKLNERKKLRVKGVGSWHSAKTWKAYLKSLKNQVKELSKLEMKSDPKSKEEFHLKVNKANDEFEFQLRFHKYIHKVKELKQVVRQGFLSLRSAKRKLKSKKHSSISFLKSYKKKKKSYKNRGKRTKRKTNKKSNIDVDGKTLRYKLRNLLRRRRLGESIFVKKRYPIWLLNTLPFIQTKKSLVHRHLLKDLKILSFLLRYLKFYNKILSKRRILFFNLLINCLSSVLVVLPKGKMANRLYTFMHLCYLYLYSFRYLYFQYNKKIFQSRFIRFNLLSKLILFSLKKISFNLPNNMITLRYYGLHNRNYNAQFLLNYLLVKLGQYYKIQQILDPLVNNLKRMPFIKGFRFIVSGRLTRKERAFFIVKSVRRMPLSSHDSRVDSAADFKIMKFGVVGIKIYLLYTDIPPFYYFFEFKNKI